MSQEIKATPAELRGLDTYSKLLDSKFRIPGTNIRFGVDFLIGLVPFGGDILSFLFSAGMVLTMTRHGASGALVGRMLGNIFLDTVVGAVPILGDIFDLFYKANRRNYRLLEAHYAEGKHQGSVWKVLVPVFIALVLLFILCVWLIFFVVQRLWTLIF